MLKHHKVYTQKIEMEPIIAFSKDNSVPSIYLDAEKGIFIFQGKSLPDNAVAFYNPIIDYLLKYQGQAQKNSEFHFCLEYFNTSSSKCLFEIFIIISKISKDGNDVTVHWNYVEEDDDMLEIGQDFAHFSGLHFIYTTVSKSIFNEHLKKETWIQL